VASLGVIDEIPATLFDLKRLEMKRSSQSWRLLLCSANFDLRTLKLTAEFLTAEEIAPLFGVSPNWLLRRTRPQIAGTDCVPHVRVGKLIRFNLDSLREWFVRHQVGV
jgi:hypothetical protein